MAKKRFDVALELARTDGVPWKVSNLVTIAIGLEQRTGDRQGALKLLEEAEESYAAARTIKTPVSNSAVSRTADQSSAKNYLNLDAVVLALAYRLFGDEVGASKWEQEAASGLTTEKLADLKIQMALMSLVYRSGFKPDEPFSRFELARVSAEIAPQLTLLEETNEGYSALRWFVEAQLKAEDYEAARANLPTLERLTLARLKGAKDMNLFSGALQVAMYWRQSGEEARAQAMLLTIMEAPGAEKVTPRDRAHALLFSGFPKEGLNWLSRLPKTKNDLTFSPSVAYYEGKYNPTKFPQWITQIKEPRQKLEAVNHFVKALAEPLYETAEEREFVLSQRYLSTSG